jgi:hypothetical protein
MQVLIIIGILMYGTVATAASYPSPGGIHRGNQPIWDGKSCNDNKWCQFVRLQKARELSRHRDLDGCPSR